MLVRFRANDCADTSDRVPGAICKSFKLFTGESVGEQFMTTNGVDITRRMTRCLPNDGHSTVSPCDLEAPSRRLPKISPSVFHTNSVGAQIIASGGTWFFR